MDRRHFLLTAAAAAAGFAVDPERALWRPGQKVTFDLWHPTTAQVKLYDLDARSFMLGDLIEIEGIYRPRVAGIQARQRFVVTRVSDDTGPTLSIAR